MRNPSIAAAALLACGLSAASQVLTASQAIAADYPVLRGSQIEDTPSPPSSDYFSERFSWTGFYAGGFAAQSQTRFEASERYEQLAANAFQTIPIMGLVDRTGALPSLPRRDSRVGYGGFAGYNFAFGDAVIGLEADYTKVDQQTAYSMTRRRQVGSSDVTLLSQQDGRLNDMFSLRARFGYAFGRVMPYFTLGAVAGRFNTNVFISATSAGSADPPSTSIGTGLKKDTWGYGGVIGGGVEAALADNIILRAEYLYTRFNDVEGLDVGVNTARVGAALKF